MAAINPARADMMSSSVLLQVPYPVYRTVRRVDAVTKVTSRSFNSVPKWLSRSNSSPRAASAAPIINTASISKSSTPELQFGSIWLPSSGMVDRL
jgi:hypothetical protein